MVLVRLNPRIAPTMTAEQVAGSYGAPRVLPVSDDTNHPLPACQGLAGRSGEAAGINWTAAGWYICLH